MTDKHDKQAALLPCPFCGKDPKHSVWSDHNYHQAECEECGYSFDYEPSFASLAKAWNRRAALASEAASQQPEGWQLVPIQPTEAMHVAAVRTIINCTGNDDFPPRVWSAMLSAAPLGAQSKEEA